MNINELFKNLDNSFLSEEIKGEFVLHGNCIIWSYNLENDCEEIESPKYDDINEFQYDFESASTEELLLEAYNDDLEKIKTYLDEIEETDNWSFSESETNENVISFKIF